MPGIDPESTDQAAEENRQRSSCDSTRRDKMSRKLGGRIGRWGRKRKCWQYVGHNIFSRDIFNHSISSCISCPHNLNRPLAKVSTQSHIDANLIHFLACEGSTFPRTPQPWSGSKKPNFLHLPSMSIPGNSYARNTRTTSFTLFRQMGQTSTCLAHSTHAHTCPQS